MAYDDGDPYFIPHDEIIDRPECVVRCDEDSWGKAMSDGIWLGVSLVAGFAVLVFPEIIKALR